MSPGQTCPVWPQCHPAVSTPSRRALLSSSSWPARGHLLLRGLAALVGVGSRGPQKVEVEVVGSQGPQEVEVEVVGSRGLQEVEVEGEP